MSYNYRPFLTAIDPLLLHNSSSPIPIPHPFIAQLHPGTPSLELGAVTALHTLSFDPTPDADVKTGLAIETQLCRNFLFDAAQGIGDGDLFLGMDALWVGHYDRIPRSSSSSPLAISAAIDSAFEIMNEGETRQQDNVLLVITEWSTRGAEKAILGCGKIEESRGGRVLTTGEYFTKNILQKASGDAKHYVVFENISAANVQWLDKEEKWSTYAARLLAGENQRKKEGAAQASI